MRSVAGIFVPVARRPASVVAPGVAIMSDGFAGASAAVNGRTLDNASGGSRVATWSEPSGLIVVDGSGRTTMSVAGTHIMSADAGQKNHKISITNFATVTSNGTAFGLVVRYTDDSNYYRIRVARNGINDNVYYLEKVVAGVVTRLAGIGALGADADPVDNTDTLTLSASDSTISATYNGTQWTVSDTDTAHATAKKVGIYQVGSGGWKINTCVISGA